MSAASTYRKWSIGREVPHEGVATRPETCRVCGAAIAEGQAVLQRAWDTRVSCAGCGWLTPAERAVLEQIARGEKVMMSGERTDLSRWGLVGTRFQRVGRKTVEIIELTGTGFKALAEARRAT